MKGKLIMSIDAMDSDRKAWEKLRNSGIGGSDVAVIVGKNKWKSPYTLWAEKTGRVEPEDLSNNEYVYWGTVLEDSIAQRFMRDTGKTVRRCGTLQDEEYGYMHANVDRLIVGENAGLECKTANGFKAKEWVDDEAPEAYILQCQWYMGITGADKWYLACLIGGNHYVCKEIPRNEADIEALREAAKYFWEKHVFADVPPEVDGSESTSDTLTKQYEESQANAIMLPSQASEWIKALDNLTTMEKMLKEQKTEAQNALKAMLGEYEQGVFNDRQISWRSQKGRETIDTKRLKAEMPQIYNQYKKVGKATRVFKLK